MTVSFRDTWPAAPGQQATFTGASRVFVLIRRFPGQKRSSIPPASIAIERTLERISQGAVEQIVGAGPTFGKSEPTAGVPGSSYAARCA
jgi:hypothetical protein